MHRRPQAPRARQAGSARTLLPIALRHVRMHHSAYVLAAIESTACNRR
jgi:hypothetical protein